MILLFPPLSAGLQVCMVYVVLRIELMVCLIFVQQAPYQLNYIPVPDIEGFMRLGRRPQ